MPSAETEENKSFAVGHLALGYILSKTSARLLKTELNIPAVLMLSVIPDIDILIQKLIPAFEHRGPTHSIITAFIVFVPIFAVYHKKAAPYLVALISHSLIGDYMVGRGIQLLWPVTTRCYGMSIGIRSQTNTTMEWTLFLISILIMLKTKDTATLLQPRNTNLILAVPTFTLLLPTFLSFPLDVPTWLIPPHVAYMSIFSASIIISLFKPSRMRKITDAIGKTGSITIETPEKHELQDTLRFFRLSIERRG